MARPLWQASQFGKHMFRYALTASAILIITAANAGSFTPIEIGSKIGDCRLQDVAGKMHRCSRIREGL
jgi:hypothetical protein